MEHLSVWMLKYPEFYAKDQILKYVGWVLSDRESDVRFAALNVLYEIYTTGSFVHPFICLRFSPVLMY
jgi:hypothetical protein